MCGFSNTTLKYSLLIFVYFSITIETEKFFIFNSSHLNLSRKIAKKTKKNTERKSHNTQKFIWFCWYDLDPRAKKKIFIVQTNCYSKSWKSKNHVYEIHNHFRKHKIGQSILACRLGIIDFYPACSTDLYLFFFSNRTVKILSQVII